MFQERAGVAPGMSGDHTEPSVMGNVALLAGGPEALRELDASET
jgi:hypothetical protein